MGVQIISKGAGLEESSDYICNTRFSLTTVPLINKCIHLAVCVLALASRLPPRADRKGGGGLLLIET
jgi:hypothetical protein